MLTLVLGCSGEGSPLILVILHSKELDMKHVTLDKFHFFEVMPLCDICFLRGAVNFITSMQLTTSFSSKSGEPAQFLTNS